MAPGVRVRVYGAHRYGFFGAQEAVVEKEWGGNAGHAQAGLVRLPFGIYDPRETYASGLIDYPMPRGDYYTHSVDWGAPGLAWSGGPPQVQVEAAGFSGRGTGIWDNQALVRGGAARAQTYVGDAIFGFSRWDGALQDVTASPSIQPVHMTGLDLRYTKTQLLLRGEYLFGTLAGDHMHGWYLDAYYRLPQYERWSLVARIERLKPGDDYAESHQVTLGVRWVATREWTLAANWRHNNGLVYSPNWTPAAPKSGDVLLQAYRRVELVRLGERKSPRRQHRLSPGAFSVRAAKAGMTGLEPAASALTGQRSNQLSYTPRECGPNEEEYTLIGRQVSRGVGDYFEAS